VHEFHISLLAYCITSNHVHLLAHADDPATISDLMQKLQGEFAEYYNLRKGRTGAFWGGRFHSTMIDSGAYLWNCMRYIDLNMVRAGAVDHPQDWRWCSYHELVGKRQRYRMLDMPKVLEMNGMDTCETLAANYRASIEDRLAGGPCRREPAWTESIAVGSQGFVEKIKGDTQHRRRLEMSEAAQNTWALREAPPSYS
jgi:putative transposase